MNILTSDELHFQVRSTTEKWNPDFHIHNFCELYLLLEGDVNIYVHDSFYHISPGTLMFFNELEMHKAVLLSNNRYRRIFIHIPPAFLHHYSTEQTDLAACFYKRDIGICNLIKLTPEQINYISRLVKNMEEARDASCFGSALLIDSYVLQILIMANSLFQAENFTEVLENPYPANIRSIIAYLDEHLLEELTLDKLSAVLALDKYHLCHIFKKETGTTIFRYILLKRIALSRILLAEGKNATEACFQSGFQNYTNFITSFRKVTGCTPKQFKDMKRNDFIN